MAFTKIVSPGIDTTGSYTVQDLNAVGVVTASAFSGPLTGNATGLTGTPDITVGAITAASADFSGNVSIAGTLTYEDVTNIDSVGVITARDGINVTGGHIGVGVIPEAWSTNLRAVQIGRQACVSGQTGANIVEISANAYHNSGWKYIESDTATSYYQYQGCLLYTSPSPRDAHESRMPSSA